MEEKERYELIGYCSYRDTKTGVIGDNFVELLNQQDKEIIKLREENQQLHSQPAEIVEKIRSKCCVEDKCEDGSFVLGINEKDLDTILKEYQKQEDKKCQL